MSQETPKNTYVTLHKNFVRTDIEYTDRRTGETRTFNSVTLPKGTVISITDKVGESTTYSSDEECVKLPMAVLCNEYSISAAEFFAASLQEYGAATVVGEHTLGKGYAQTMIPLTGGGALNLSTSRYYTAKGVSLAGVGITPDVESSLSEDKLNRFYTLQPEEDDQLQKALEVLEQQMSEN